MAEENVKQRGRTGCYGLKPSHYLRPSVGGQGFTLVELLVVVAIIAVLAALLMPAIQSAIVAAQGAQCRSNARQIGQGMMMHAHDFDGYLPFYGDPVHFGRLPGGGNDGSVGTQWDVQTMPYVGMEAWEWGSVSPPPELGLRPTVFYCPAVKPAFIDNRPTQYVWSRSYCYNQRVGQNIRGSRSLALLEDPIRTFLLMDSVHASFEPWTDRSGYLGRGRTGTIRYQQTSLVTRGQYSYRHRRTAHLLFADGHVDARPQGPTQYPAGVRFGNGYPVYPWPE